MNWNKKWIKRVVLGEMRCIDMTFKTTTEWILDELDEIIPDGMSGLLAILLCFAFAGIGIGMILLW